MDQDLLRAAPADRWRTHMRPKAFADVCLVLAFLAVRSEVNAESQAHVDVGMSCETARQNILDEIRYVASFYNYCRSDDDCIAVDGGVSCLHGCAIAIRTTNEGRFEQERFRLSTENCGSYSSHCGPWAPTCGAGDVVCVDHSCTITTNSRGDGVEDVGSGGSDAGRETEGGDQTENGSAAGCSCADAGI